MKQRSNPLSSGNVLEGCPGADLLADLPLLREGRLLTAAEVGALLGVDRRRVYALRNSGVVRGHKIGRSIRFTPSSVLNLLEDARDEGWPAW